MITLFAGKISTLIEWSYLLLKELLQEVIQCHNSSVSALLPLLRMALTGLTAGPDVIAIIYLLGKDKSCRRITTFSEAMKKR